MSDLVTTFSDGFFGIGRVHLLPLPFALPALFVLRWIYYYREGGGGRSEQSAGVVAVGLDVVRVVSGVEKAHGVHERRILPWQSNEARLLERLLLLACCCCCLHSRLKTSQNCCKTFGHSN